MSLYSENCSEKRLSDFRIGEEFRRQKFRAENHFLTGQHVIIVSVSYYRVLLNTFDSWFKVTLVKESSGKKTKYNFRISEFRKPAFNDSGFVCLKRFRHAGRHRLDRQSHRDLDRHRHLVDRNEIKWYFYFIQMIIMLRNET